MDEAAITRYITDTFSGVETDTSTDDTFFFCDPDRMFPFATIVTHDDSYDNVSNLDRPSVFRLNIGVSKQTYNSLFGHCLGRTRLVPAQAVLPIATMTSPPLIN